MAKGIHTEHTFETRDTTESIFQFKKRTGKFLHLSVEEYELNGIKKIIETMIFPRHHQLDVVCKVTKEAKEKGAGQNYLIQHSQVRANPIQLLG